MLQYLSPQYRHLQHFLTIGGKRAGETLQGVTLQPPHRRPNDARHEQQNRDEAAAVRVRIVIAHVLRREVQDGVQEQRVHQRQQEAFAGRQGVTFTHGQHP